MTAQKTITRTEFEKKVEMEAAYLTYMDRLSPNEANQKARETVSKEYRVE